MVCPFCLHKKTIIANSRSTSRLNQTWRRHRCPECGKSFTTREKVDLESIVRVRPAKARKTVPYQQSKLLFSILRACDHRPDVEHTAFWLLDTVEQQLLKIVGKVRSDNPALTSSDIYNTTLQVIQQFDQVAYIKYRSSNEHIPYIAVSGSKLWVKSKK